MRSLWHVGAMLGLASAAGAQPAQAPRTAMRSVTFEVVSPVLPDTASVFVTGSLPALGGWQPDRVRLLATGGHRWRVTVQVPADASIEYKFTLGSWEREGADSAGRSGPNFRARIGRDTTITTLVPRWRSGPRERVLNGQVTGTLRRHPIPAADGVPSRELVVWLPPGYEEPSTRRYPVLYMFDGQNLFDPATSSFGTDWAVDEAVDSLIRAGVIEPLIVVGMTSTAARSAEYLPGPKASAHLRMVIEGIKPFIDAAYRTRPGRESTWIGGSSAGGIAAFRSVWERPDVFSRALALSPAFIAPRDQGVALSYIGNVRRKPEAPRSVRFYIDIGGVGLEDVLRPGVDSMQAALRDRGYREEVDVRIVRDPEATHDELAWRRRFPAALAWLLR